MNSELGGAQSFTLVLLPLLSEAPPPPPPPRSFAMLEVQTTLIEMLGEFFLINDEGRRCKVIYDENIFPHIWRKIPLDFP